jgi:hypothetical protein
MSANAPDIRFDHANHNLHFFTSLNVDDYLSGQTNRNLTEKNQKSNNFAQGFPEGEKYGQAEGTFKNSQE